MEAHCQGQCRRPVGGTQQTALEASSECASGGKGIDADAGEADKKRTGLTFERRSVGEEPQYNAEYVEWI